MNENFRQSTAEVMLDILRSEGVRYIFGNPGTTEMPLINALDGVQDMSYVLGLQEASVISMADGYATTSGRTGFVNVHTAGGLGHGMGALLHSRIANTPLVITAGQQDTRHAAMDPLLGGDPVELARPLVKWAREVTHPEQLPMLLRRAFNDSAAAPRGPVFLSLPMDVMERTTLATAGQKSRIHHASVAGGLDELSDALVAIPRLALIAGDELSDENALAETTELAELLGAPVFGSSWPDGQPFPATHPLWSGNLPSNAADLRACLQNFDAVLVLGGHSLITYLYTPGPALPPTCRLFQLTANSNNLGRLYSTTWGSVGNIEASLRALIPEIRRKIEPHRNAIALLHHAAAQKQATYRAELTKRLQSELRARTITPFVAAHEVLRGAGSKAAIVDESPVTMESVRACLRVQHVRKYLFMRSAVLGWGMPAAVGASLGLDREPVVALVGDGSALYSPQALWTAAHEQLPVTFVVMNNREYGILKGYMRDQKQYAGARAGRFIGTDLVNPSINFRALAESMGLTAVQVHSAADLAGAVEANIASGAPGLIEVPIS